MVALRNVRETEGKRLCVALADVAPRAAACTAVALRTHLTSAITLRRCCCVIHCVDDYDYMTLFRAEFQNH